MIPAYVAQPLRSLASGWEHKLPWTSVLTLVWTLFESVLGLYQHLLSMNPGLLAFNVLAVAVDTLSGMTAAVREDGWSGLTSYRFRATGWKVVEYAMVTLVFVGFENATSATFAEPVSQYFGNGILIYIGFTETWSVKENLTRLGLDMSTMTDLMEGDFKALAKEVNSDES